MSSKITQNCGVQPLRFFSKVPRSVRFKPPSNRTSTRLQKQVWCRSPVITNNNPVKVKMGSSVGKRLMPNKVAPSADIKKKTINSNIYCNRTASKATKRIEGALDYEVFGPRQVNVRRGRNQNGQSNIENIRRIKPPERKRRTLQNISQSCSRLSSPDSYSLPSRSDILPPDGDSLRSDGERTTGSSISLLNECCLQCTQAWREMEKSFTQKDQLKKTLGDKEEILASLQKKVKSLEQERELSKNKIQAVVENLRELEGDMCQLQKDKAQLVHELHVTRRHLTRALEQDTDISTLSHVSSIYVSGTSTTDDGFSDDISPDEDPEYDRQRRIQEQLVFFKSEVQRLKEVEMSKEQLEKELQSCQLNISKLHLQLSEVPCIEKLAKHDCSTQTARRDSTFTRPSIERTRIPKPLYGHHSSLPVISDNAKLDKNRITMRSCHDTETFNLNLVEKEKEILIRNSDINRFLQAKKKSEKMINAESKDNSPFKEFQEENRLLKEELKIVKENYQKEMVLRKKYFNMTEDLKGKIRVFCRIRPDNCTYKKNGSTLESPDDYTVSISNQRAKYEFNFDQVFMPNVTQDEIFQEVKNLIQCAMDGYNVCIFAYGQTGSGKTHTLVGNKMQPGIGPRAFQRIFNIVQEKQHELNTEIFASVYELYNEQLIDLLKNFNEDKLTIRKDSHGLVYVQGSEVRQVRSEQELSELFEEACQNRHTGATRMNAESSRSHLIISILIQGTNKLTGTLNKGKLSLVDLAGSERIGKSAAVAEQIKEANSINKSLSALGDVIAALSTGQSHVPYRNNKLTLLMQDSLGNNAKTLMFVTISPSSVNTEETLNSLMYATRVKQVSNSASRNSECREVARLKSIIMKLSKGERGSSQV